MARTTFRRMPPATAVPTVSCRTPNAAHHARQESHAGASLLQAPCGDSSWPIDCTSCACPAGSWCKSGSPFKKCTCPSVGSSCGDGSACDCPTGTFCVSVTCRACTHAAPLCCAGCAPHGAAPHQGRWRPSWRSRFALAACPQPRPAGMQVCPDGNKKCGDSRVCLVRG